MASDYTDIDRRISEVKAEGDRTRKRLKTLADEEELAQMVSELLLQAAASLDNYDRMIDVVRAELNQK